MSTHPVRSAGRIVAAAAPVALDEIIDARVWGGIHFRTADVDGAELGESVARRLEKHYLQPLR